MYARGTEMLHFGSWRKGEKYFTTRMRRLLNSYLPAVLLSCTISNRKCMFWLPFRKKKKTDQSLLLESINLRTMVFTTKITL